jgi:hypothetical protein
MITVRQAVAKDVVTIRDIFLACYGTDYSPRYYDENQLTRLVYSDDSLLLVAEDTESGEIVVSAYAPRMQRTLLELGFLPVAYIPAFAFDEVDRLDVVKMFLLPASPEVNIEALAPRYRTLADLVLRRFRTRSVLPRVAAAVHRLPLFAGLIAEQVTRLAGVCGTASFEPGTTIFREGETDHRMHVVLQGAVEIAVADSNTSVGMVHDGECLGEISLLTGAPHSASATARTYVETAVLDHADLAELIRLRPDIGLHIYRNLAVGAGEKLKRMDVSAQRPPE